MIKIISLIVVIAFTIGCSSTSIKHVNKEEFKVLANKSQKADSAYYYRIIGSTKKGTYLEHWNGITKKTTIYWTEEYINILWPFSGRVKGNILPYYTKPKADN